MVIRLIKLIVRNATFVSSEIHRFNLNDDCLYDEPVNLNLINDYVQAVAGSFVGSIIYTEQVWVLVTQVDAFVRNNKYVDDCAIETEEEYHDQPAAKIIRKTNYTKAAFEMSIFYGGLELLVVGGLFGECSSDNIIGSLGPSTKTVNTKLNGKLHVQKDWKLMMPASANSCFYYNRLLQNYCKLQASQKWSACSAFFARRRFRCHSPLNIIDKSYICAASMIVNCVANNTFTEQNESQLYNLIREVHYAKQKEVLETDSIIEYLDWLNERIEGDGWYSVVVNNFKLLVEARSNRVSPQAAINGENATALYSRALKSRCTTTNNNAIKNQVFLL